MKQLFSLIIMFLALLSSSALAAGAVHTLKNAKLYEVGKHINPGKYTLEFDKNEKLKLALITVGDDLQYASGRDAVLIKNGQFSEYKIDKNTPQLTLDLVEGNKLFVNAGSPKLIPQKTENPDIKPTSIEIQAGLYLVGKDINEGLYIASPLSPGKYPTVFYGDYHYASNPVSPKSGEFTETIMKESQIKLDSGKYLRIAGGAVHLKYIEEATSSLKVDDNQKNSIQTKKLTADEIKRITSKAPYVSSKNITIDSSDGVDFYTYFGSGIIMSGISGDCFKMVDCDDESIVDHYKLMPVKPGKGNIEYVINMKKKIVVNITVKNSAFEQLKEDSAKNATIAHAVKNVNIRSKASTSSDKIGELKKGEKVKVITAFYAADWHEIEYKNKICYVSAKYLELE